MALCCSITSGTCGLTEEKLILDVIQVCFCSVSEFVVSCSCISKASLIMASCIMGENRLSFCCDRNLLLFITWNSVSKTPIFCYTLEEVLFCVFVMCWMSQTRSLMVLPWSILHDAFQLWATLVHTQTEVRLIPVLLQSFL